ncbi:hypothetical protein TrCOL_g5516 [Triparma columacea]|uniref:Uncharacterized protein n=1 Tax=Triparma columacea TaxID=722753 RepID=A0A9W7G203_9STRA|nr:hypothetical protein TrCOL_g5516 [Triparma columacea]
MGRKSKDKQNKLSAKEPHKVSDQSSPIESPWSLDGDYGYGDTSSKHTSHIPPNLELDDDGNQPASSETKQSAGKKKKKKLLPINMNIKTKVSTAGSYQASSTDRSGFGGGPRRTTMPSLYDSGSSGWTIISIYEKVRGGVVAGLDYFGVGASTTRYSYEPVNMSEGGFGGGGLGAGSGVADIRTCCVIS